MKQFFPLIAMALGGCASTGEFPSLAPRAVETQQAAPSKAIAATSNPAALARIAAAEVKARSGLSAFYEALAAARGPVAKAGAKGSDSWAAAQAALARLERTREPVQLALIDLTEEQRIILFGPPSLDRPAVDAAISGVKQIEAEQLAAVQALQSALNRR